MNNPTPKSLLWKIHKANEKYAERQKVADHYSKVAAELTERANQAAEKLAYTVKVFQETYPELHDKLLADGMTTHRAISELEKSETKQT